MWMRRAERPLTEIPHSEFCIPHCLMYIELHCHSAFSFLDGASLPEQLALTASQLGYPALALTDHHGLYGSMAFAQEAKQDRKSTRLNSSHLVISYAVFCLKKKKRKQASTERRLDGPSRQ